MATIAYDRQPHVNILSVIGYQLLETFRQVLELRFSGKARFNQFGLHLHLVLEVLKRRAIKISCVGFWRDCCTGGVMVGTAESVKSASLRKVVRVIHLGLVILIDGHHILKIITLGSIFRTLSYPTIICLLKRMLVLRDIALLGLVLESS